MSMQSFKALEQRYERVPLRSVDLSLGDAAGFLMLDRKRTRVALSSTEKLAVQDSKNGWFDLWLRDNSDQPLLLHHALFLNAPRPLGRTYESHIFPNVVVFDADKISRDLKIRSVAFQLHSLGSFFDYEIVEHVSAYELKKNGKAKLLTQLRTRKSQRNIRFNPVDIFLVHRPPQAVKFQIEKRKYSIFMGWTSSHGWGSKLDISVEPVATIDFGESIHLDDAIDFVWEWKRFFSQVAMQSLDVVAFGARSRRHPRHSLASLYFPNEQTTTRHIRAGEVPLKLWKDRKTLSLVMAQWLSKERERRVFRVAVDHVLQVSNERDATEDLVTLCGAVESLVELKSHSALDRASIDAIVRGAIAASREARIDIDEQRISGLLGMLKKENLSGRLKHVIDLLSPKIHPDFTRYLSGSIRELRNAAAHGARLSEMTRPKIGPTIQGLLAACINYDLATSGMLQTWDRSSILPLVEANRAVMQLERLSTYQSVEKND